MTLQEPDSVKICLECLFSGENKELAYVHAQSAHKRYWVLNGEGFSNEEIERLLTLRAVVYGTIAAVYVWNDQLEKAFDLEEEFLYDSSLWTKENQQPIEIYLMHLLIKKQNEHLAQIFNDSEEFTKVFLPFQDVNFSYLNPSYEFRSGVYKYTDTVNRVNQYSRMLTGEKLM